MKSVTLLCPQTTDTQRAFCRKSQSFGLGQTNLAEVWMAFGVFPTKLEHPSWHCELLIHGPFIQKFFQANKRPHINFYFIKIFYWLSWKPAHTIVKLSRQCFTEKKISFSSHVWTRTATINGQHEMDVMHADEHICRLCFCLFLSSNIWITWY